MSSPAGQSNNMINPAHLQNGYAQLGNQQAFAAQHNHMKQAYNQVFEAKRWMINGQAMDIEEFGKELFGDDTPELTMFLLKYKDVDTKIKD